MKLEKKIDDWVRQGLELEANGLTPGVVGHKSRLSRLKAWRNEVQLYRRLVLRAGKSDLRISIVKKPELTGDHIKLGMILELPVGSERRGLSVKSRNALETFVRQAVGEATRPRPRGQKARLHGKGKGRRKKSAV